MKNTKIKLLNTAAKMFARQGIDGVSTRDLAKRAKVNLCSINYYFGSKQKLYDAVIDEVIASITDKFILPIQKISENTPRGKIKQIISNFFRSLCGDVLSDDQAMLLVNEIICPSTAYNKLYDKIIEPVHKHISELVAADLKLPENHPKILILTHTLFGQAIIFRIHKEALLRRMKIKKLTPELLDLIYTHIQQNCDAILDRAGEA